MIELLREYGLTDQEIEDCEKKYDPAILKKAIKKAVFKTKDCFRESLKIVLKYYNS